MSRYVDALCIPPLHRTKSKHGCSERVRRAKPNDAGLLECFDDVMHALRETRRWRSLVSHNFHFSLDLRLGLFKQNLREVAPVRMTKLLLWLENWRRPAPQSAVRLSNTLRKPLAFGHIPCSFLLAQSPSHGGRRASLKRWIYNNTLVLLEASHRFLRPSASLLLPVRAVTRRLKTTNVMTIPATTMIQQYSHGLSQPSERGKDHHPLFPSPTRRDLLPVGAAGRPLPGGTRHHTARKLACSASAGLGAGAKALSTLLALTRPYIVDRAAGPTTPSRRWRYACSCRTSSPKISTRVVSV